MGSTQQDAAPGQEPAESKQPVGAPTILIQVMGKAAGMQIVPAAEEWTDEQMHSAASILVQLYEQKTGKQFVKAEAEIVTSETTAPSVAEEIISERAM